MFKVMNVGTMGDFADIARGAHEGQKRDCGGDYFDLHIKGVVGILAYIAEDCKVHRGESRSINYIIALGYMHDVIEDCDEWMTKIVISELLREIIDEDRTVNHFIDDLEQLTTSGPRAYRYDESSTKTDRISQLIRTGSPEAVAVKFADRINNLMSMETSWNEKRQMKYLDASENILKTYMNYFPHDNYPPSLATTMAKRLASVLEKTIRQIRYDLTKRNSESN